MPIKRLHYFDHQFLVEKDFTEEQGYHLGMRRRLNKLLYSPGIAEGLLVVKKSATLVTIQKGAAIDDQGQEIILEADQDVDLSNRAKFPAGATVTVSVLYQEQQTDPTTATGVTGNTRITEQALPEATSGSPSVGAIPLARFQLVAGSGDVPATTLDGGVRKTITPKSGQGIASVGGVSNPGGDVGLLPGAGVTITPDVANRRITIGSTITPGVASVDGVAAPGGNIDLQAGRGIQITPDSPNRRITIDALGPATLAGVSNAGGDIQVAANPASSISIAADNVAKRILIGENHSARTDNPHGTTAAQVGALLASDYFFGKRTNALVQFTQADATGATRTINTAFGSPPRYVFAIGSLQMALGGRNYGGGLFGFADLVNAPLQQSCTGFGVTKLNNNDWLVRLPSDATGIGAGLGYGTFFSSETAPAQSETLLVSVNSFTILGLSVALTRTTSAGAAQITAPNNFQFNIRLFIFG